MAFQPLPVETKTKTHVNQIVGIAVVSVLGAGAVAALLFFGNRLQKDQSATTAPVTTNASSGTSVDLTTQETPKADATSTAYAQALAAATVTAPASDVTVQITSPTEGAVVNGATPVTVALTDPNHRTAGVRMYIYSDVWPAYFGGRATLGLDSTPPYTFTPDYVLYPSGEFLYVAQAIDANANVLAATDRMVTWARTCYYLAYQDMTLTGPTSTVNSGSTFTMTGTLKNNMRGNCQNIYFLRTSKFGSNTSLLPNGWTATITPEQLDMGIGETKTFTVSVKVPAGTGTGTYPVGVSSARQYTGFIVDKSVDVSVVLPVDGTPRTQVQIPND